VNKEWSAYECEYPREIRAVDNFENHCRLACFSPYKDLCNLQTVLEEELGGKNPGGRSIYTSSCRSP
jgi:hypothetical protein